MLSLISAANTHIPTPHRRSSPHLNRRPLNLEFNPKKRCDKYFQLKSVNSIVTASKRRNVDWRFRCKVSEGDDGELESAIMDFMAKSDKPTMFPTEEELVNGGRVDLVEAIRRRGGWFSLGWDEEDVGENVDEMIDFDNDMYIDMGEFHRRVERCNESAERNGGFEFSSDVDSSDEDSGRSLEIGAADEGSGIEGILSRLEKQMNSDFGLNVGENGYLAHAERKDDGDGRHIDTSLGVAGIDLEVNGKVMSDFHQKGVSNTSGGKISRDSERETWRTWSNQRAGFQNTEFEAAEISFDQDRVETDTESYRDGIIVSSEQYTEAWYRYEEINHNQIRTRLQHLECELTTALNSLRSKKEAYISEEITESSSDLQKLSDAWEFQENEFMSAKGKLRSIRAKLAVLEGKMALAIIDAQKIVEVKQKRIDGARKALQLLRTTCIVWPNSASEVLLAGSFDGWTTQRKMEKSRTGIFSVILKLYPGKYEIKFIVDGVWKVDPLRPTVKNNGYENNLLIVQ